jgi:heme exporter protein C
MKRTQASEMVRSASKMATAVNPTLPPKTGAQAAATIAVGLFLAVAGYAALFVAPTEATMGLIQRIFYFHVPFGWSAFVAFAISFVSSIAYLRTRAPKWDWLAVSSAEVGVPFVTVMLVTGPIWAHPVWGIWWTWDARLTSTFVLWVLYVCYLLLRTLIDEPERRAVVSAVFNIFAAFDIPLVYFSIWFFRTQHPQPVIGAGGSLDPRMLDVLLLCWGATLALLALLLRQRYRVEKLRWEVERLRLESENSAAAPVPLAVGQKGRPA